MERQSSRYTITAWVIAITSVFALAIIVGGIATWLYTIWPPFTWTFTLVTAWGAGYIAYRSSK